MVFSMLPSTTALLAAELSSYKGATIVAGNNAPVVASNKTRLGTYAIHVSVRAIWVRSSVIKLNGKHLSPTQASQTARQNIENI